MTKPSNIGLLNWQTESIAKTQPIHLNLTANPKACMRTDKIRPLAPGRSFLPCKEWLNAVWKKWKVVSLVGGLLAANYALALPVNVLWVPLTNNAPAITSMPSDTGLGGVNINLNMLNAAGTASDLAGANGSGVNGAASGTAAMVLTNGAGGAQPAGGNGERALDNSDPILAFGSITNFVVTFWVNELAQQPATIGPRLFVLNTGATAADATANSIAVKFQTQNELFFEINNTADAIGTAQVNNYPANKWLFFAFVWDGTNLFEYDGSDTAPCVQASKVAAPIATVLPVNLTAATASLMLGDRGNLGRGLDGWMEDFRFYTGLPANNLSYVESIREAIAPKIPVINGFYPDGTTLMQNTNTFVFNASAPSGFNLTNIDLKLNGVDVSSSLTFVTNGTAGTSTNVSVSYTGLQQQSTITAQMTVKDAFGLIGSASVTFDTFNPTNFIIKAEEFDFTNGMFIDNPDYTNVPGDTNSYFGNGYVQGVDADKGGPVAGGDFQATDYRFDDGTGDNVQTPLSTGELPSPTRFGGNVVPSHCIGAWSSAEWQNYTKTFPPGNYNVFARMSTSSGSTVNFDQVTSGQGTPNQTLSRLGQFTFNGSGLTAWQWVPLRQFGSLAVVNLGGGVATVRATTGGGANADFFMLVPANTNLPTISSIYPDGQFLFEPTNTMVFTVSSAVTNISTTNIQMTLNGSNVSSGLVFSGGPSTWNVSYPGLQLNQSYAVVIQVTDNNGANANAQLSIDTWNPVFQVEAEDFDFDPAKSIDPDLTGFRFIDNAIPTPPRVAATNSYEDQVGDIFIDEQGNNNLPAGESPIQANLAGANITNYRTNDPCATTVVTDTPRRQFGPGTSDYNVGFLGSGHWEQYTRTWPSGTFNLYCRVASGAGPQGGLNPEHSSWSQVIAGWGTTNQVTRHIGTFVFATTAGYSSYFYTPLIDRFGNYAQLTLGGTNTFRDTHLVFNQTETANGAEFGENINFYMLLNARTDQARIDAIYPDGTLLQQGTNAFSFIASSPTYGINTTNVQVTLNGVNVSSNLVFNGSSGSWNVSYPGLQPNSSYTAVITVTDNNNQAHTVTVNFDTFNPTNFTWEAEDFDFDPANSPVPDVPPSNLRFIDNPVPTSAPATNSYFGQVGDLDIDYSSQFLNVLPLPTVYRSSAENINNIVPIEVTADALRARTLNAQLQQVNPNILDYDIFNLTNNAWIDYTHTFPTGNYYVYARLEAGGTGKDSLQLAQVTNGAGTSTQTTNILGYFQVTGNNNASFQYVPLINTNTGQHAEVSLSGIQTLQVQGDGFERVNFFMLVPPSTVTLTPSIRGNNVVLSFPTQTGFKYVVSYKNNLTDPAWTPLGAPVNGTGLTQSITDSLSQSQRFYVLTIQ